MKRTHPALWGAGWSGLALGTLTTFVGLVGGGEVAQMAAGYGLLVSGSAVYLLVGLGLRAALARRAQAVTTVAIGSRATAAPRQS